MNTLERVGGPGLVCVVRGEEGDPLDLMGRLEWSGQEGLDGTYGCPKWPGRL